MDATIITHGACSFGTDSVDLAVAWIKALAGVISGDNFVTVAKDIIPDPQVVDQMKDMAKRCLDPVA